MALNTSYSWLDLKNDLFYLELSAQNTSSTQLLPLNFTINFNKPLLSNVGLYDVAIESWILPYNSQSLYLTPFSSPLRRLDFLTTTLPVLGDIDGRDRGSIQRKLTDFRVDPFSLNTSGSKDVLTFSSSLNRYYSLNGTQPLTNINIGVGLLDRYDIERLINIPPLDVFHIKLKFRKRESNAPA